MALNKLYWDLVDVQKAVQKAEHIAMHGSYPEFYINDSIEQLQKIKVKHNTKSANTNSEK